MLRIGINLGDVVVEGSDLYGDGVNVAARLKEMAEPGGILISGTVLTTTSGKKLMLAFDDLGLQRIEEHGRAGARLPNRRHYRRPESGAQRSNRQTIHRRPPLHQHERRSAAAILQRRHHGRHHHRAVALPLAGGQGAAFVVRSAWPILRCGGGWAQARRGLRARRIGSKGGRRSARDGAAV